MKAPFFRPDITDAEIQEVVATLRSGWLTSGPRVRRFEQEFAQAVGAQHAVAVNSCTAALHLAVEAMGLRRGQAVLVPTMTFAATAEIVRYQGAVPVLIDCDPQTLNMDLGDAEMKIEAGELGELPEAVGRDLELVGMIPVHVGGVMMDVNEVKAFSRRHGLWVIEDSAHAFPAAFRGGADQPWRRCGEDTAAASCFSFYANKTITTGEGGMAVTDDHKVAERIRLMSLHGLSHDAWKRYSGGGSWDYQIAAPGFKYNLTDVAAAIGIHQLQRAEEMRQRRESIARCYGEAFASIEELELPAEQENRIHAWHLFPIKLNLDRLSIDRNRFMEELKKEDIGCSVHWRPLHLHDYYREAFHWKPEHLPVATEIWQRIITLPLFPAMTETEVCYVVEVVKNLCRRHGK